MAPEKPTERSPPSDIAQLQTVAKYSFLHYHRSNRFLILLSLLLAIGAGAMAVVGYYRPAGMLSSPTAFFKSWFGYTVPYVVPLSAVFFGAEAVSSEFQDKTAYSMFGNPIGKTTLLLGKLLAATAASLTALAAFVGIMLADGIYYFGVSIPYQFWTSSAFLILYVLACIGITFFFSSVFKSGGVSLFFSAAGLLMGFSIIETLVESFTTVEPWFSLNYNSNIIVSNFVVPYPLHAAHYLDHVAYFATIPEGLVVMSLYFVLFVLLSVAIFRSKELA